MLVINPFYSFKDITFWGSYELEELHFHHQKRGNIVTLNDVVSPQVRESEFRSWERFACGTRNPGNFAWNAWNPRSIDEESGIQGQLSRT